MSSRKAYQFIQVRVQLKGRGVTNEIDTLHVNGKNLKPGLKTLHAFLNYLGTQGFQVVAVQMETEGVFTYFYTLQREVYTQEPLTEDIFETIANASSGASIGHAVKGAFDFFEN